MAETITGKLEAFELDGTSSTWVDITEDVYLAGMALRCAYGIRGDGPLDRVSGTGTLRWMMENSASNSGATQGYYSPGHGSARQGWGLGTLVRWSVEHATPGQRFKFVGTIVELVPDAGIKGRRGVTCRAVDWIDEAARAKLRNVPVQESKRADEIVATIISNSVTRQPPATNFEVGRSTFVQALDNIDEERDNVLGAISKVVRSEFGYFFLRGTTSGTEVRLEDRRFRLSSSTVSAANTFDNTMVSLSAKQTRDTIINRVNVVIHPRKTDDIANTVLFELTPTDSVPSVEPSGTLTVVGLLREETGRFVRVGGKGLITPQASTDYVANTHDAGTGTDVTGDVSVAATAQSNSVVFTLTNSGSVTAYFTKLRIRGKAIQDTYQVMMTASSTASEDSYGEHAVRYDMPYESDINIGAAVAKFLVDNYKDPFFSISMGIAGNKNATLADRAVSLEPGDKIAIRETVTGVTDSGSIAYFINGVSYTFQAGDILWARYDLIRAVEEDAWVLEEAGSSLGTNTTLGSL